VQEFALVEPGVSEEPHTHMCLTIALDSIEDNERLSIIHRGAVDEFVDLYDTMLDMGHPINKITSKIGTRGIKMMGDGTISLRACSRELGYDWLPGFKPFKATTNGTPTIKDIIDPQFLSRLSEEEAIRLVLLHIDSIPAGKNIIRVSLKISFGIEKVSAWKQIFPFFGPDYINDILRKQIDFLKTEGGKVEDHQSILDAYTSTRKPQYDIIIAGRPGPFSYELQEHEAERPMPILYKWFNPTTAVFSESSIFHCFNPAHGRFSMYFGCTEFVREIQVAERKLEEAIINRVREGMTKMSSSLIRSLKPAIIYALISGCQITVCVTLFIFGLFGLLSRESLPISALLAIGGTIWFLSGIASMRRMINHTLKRR
jgi:hypothetical protein